MKAAVAKCLGVSDDKIDVNYDSKRVTVDTDKAKADMVALGKALEEGGFSIKM